jgi:light-regulated signal transduction histidine kinase (bacteriophytochrome)
MPTEHDTNRADRLLRRMHPVLSHDLPNQMVALQSLVQMLERENGEQPTAQEQETFQRLQRVAGKTATMVRFLRELCRLNTYPCRIEEVRLASLIREIKVELRQHVADGLVECQLAGDVKTLFADRRLLIQSLVELLRCLIGRRPAGSCSLRIHGNLTEDATELRGELTWSNDVPPIPPDTIAPERTSLMQRLEIALAHELLAACGIRLIQVRELSNHAEFTLFVPNPSDHG